MSMKQIESPGVTVIETTLLHCSLVQEHLLDLIFLHHLIDWEESYSLVFLFPLFIHITPPTFSKVLVGCSNTNYKDEDNFTSSPSVRRQNLRRVTSGVFGSSLNRNSHTVASADQRIHPNFISHSCTPSFINISCINFWIASRHKGQYSCPSIPITLLPWYTSHKIRWQWSTTRTWSCFGTRSIPWWKVSSNMSICLCRN